jgi:hypothetical protein
VASIVDGTTGNDSNILRRLSLTAQHQSVLNIGYGSASEPVSIRYIFATDTFLVLNVFFGSGATEKNILAIHNLDGSIDTQIADYGTDIFSTRPSGIVACVSNDENRWYGLDFTTGNIKIADLENKIMLADISSGLGAQAKIYSMGATKHALVCIEGGNSAIVELQHPVIKIHIWDIDQTTGAYVKRPDNGANLRGDFFATENNCFLIG